MNFSTLSVWYACMTSGYELPKCLTSRVTYSIRMSSPVIITLVDCLALAWFYDWGALGALGLFCDWCFCALWFSLKLVWLWLACAFVVDWGTWAALYDSEFLFCMPVRLL